ncbi:MAG: hypothetical protein NT062_28510 [Proteobacteria bacterium]|nr:hypothetical protein [Pseudomonadota bacterium]
MGPQRVLQALVVVATCTAATASSAEELADELHERVAVIDLGPATDGAIATRQRIAAAISAAGLVPIAGDGVEDALAGNHADRDVTTLAAAMEATRTAFGSLDCAQATSSARRAIAIAAGRQAAGLATPELSRAWAFVLLCADRHADTDAAMFAAGRLRAVGGSPDVPTDLLDKYPDVDVIGGQARARDVTITAGPQVPLVVDTPDARGAWSALADRIAGWQGKVPSPTELAWVLTQVRARVAIVRYGDTAEAWGQPGRVELPYRLGAGDGVGRLDEVPRILQLVVDRVHAWTDHAPDPDRPLLVETTRALRDRNEKEPTPWWVYASIAGAIAGAALVVYLHDSAADVQHVELHFPSQPAARVWP